jgi:hypothetical protein
MHWRALGCESSTAAQLHVAILTVTLSDNVFSDPESRPSKVLGSCSAALRLTSVPILHKPVALTAMILANSSSETILFSVGQMPAHFTHPSSLSEMASMELLYEERDVTVQFPVHFLES